MIILGIDPGTTAAGYALLEYKAHIPKLLDAGILSVSAPSTSERLVELHYAIERLISEWHPAAVSIEKLFFAANAKTAISVAEARGVILLTTALAGIIVYEYTPLQIKKTITGDGRADKIQVRKMVKITLPGIAGLRARDDVFDAIAIALTCLYLDLRFRCSEKT